MKLTIWEKLTSNELFSSSWKTLLLICKESILYILCCGWWNEDSKLERGQVSKPPSRPDPSCLDGAPKKAWKENDKWVIWRRPHTQTCQHLWASCEMLLCVAHFSLNGSAVRKENDLISNLVIYWILEKTRICKFIPAGWDLSQGCDWAH